MGVQYLNDPAVQPMQALFEVVVIELAGAKLQYMVVTEGANSLKPAGMELQRRILLHHLLHQGR